MERFIRVARVSEVKAGKGRLAHVAGIGKVAIFSAGGAFYAAQDRCTDDGRSLSEGTVKGTQIECSSDKARFYLPTGECIYPPGIESLKTYKVRIDGDEVQIDLGETLESGVSEVKAVA